MKVTIKKRQKNNIKKRTHKRVSPIESINYEHIITRSYATVIKTNFISESFFSFYMLLNDSECIREISDYFEANGLIRDDTLQQDSKLFFDFDSPLGCIQAC